MNHQIPGVSRRALVAIATLETRNPCVGSVGQALERYRHFLRRPGRWLYIPWPDCPWCDPVDARDELEIALRALPRAARRELRRVIAPLDEELRRRTLPDPMVSPSHSSDGAGWWRRRLYER